MKYPVYNKKYYNLYILILLLILISLNACCNCGKNLQEENVIKGTIAVIGNDPFTKLALRTDDNKIYVLQMSNELKNELMKKQGARYYIHYSELREEEEIPTIVVEKVIQIVKEEK